MLIGPYVFKLQDQRSQVIALFSFSKVLPVKGQLGLSCIPIAL